MSQFGWLNEDVNKRIAAQRALSDSSTALIQNFLNTTVQHLVLRELGIHSVLRSRPGRGSQAQIVRRTAKTGTNRLEWVGDTDSPTEATGSYAQTNFNYRTGIAKGRVTRFLRAAGAAYGDAWAMELEGAAGDYAEGLETGCSVGDSGASGDAESIDGLITQINGVSGQVIAQTTAAAGDDVTVAALDETIDAVKGSANKSDMVIFGSQAGLRKVNAALQSQQQFVNTTEIAAGFRVKTYDGIPLVPSTEIPDDLTWATSTIQALSGGSTTALIVVNLRYYWLEYLTPTTVMPLARTTSQYEEFELYTDVALVQGNTLGGAILGGVSPS